MVQYVQQRKTMKWTIPTEQANLHFCIQFDYQCLNGHKNPIVKSFPDDIMVLS